MKKFTDYLVGIIGITTFTAFQVAVLVKYLFN